MKLVNAFMLNMLLLGGLNFSTCKQAKADEHPQLETQKIISTEIKKKLSFPDELLGQSINERVIIEFKLSQDKKIEIIGIEAKNPILKSHITKQLGLVEVADAEGLKGRVLQISVLFVNGAP